MNVLFSFVEMFVNKVLIYKMSLVRCLWTWQTIKTIKFKV